MWTLALACVFFLGIHLLISGTLLRERLLGAIGGPAYYMAFSILSLVGLIAISVAFTFALSDPMNIVLWQSGPFLRIVGQIGNFFAFFLLVCGLTMLSPTNLLALKHMPDKPVHGIIRVSRHPVLAGIGLWALTHIITNGNLAGWMFFGTLLALCGLGANLIDVKRKRLMGDSYSAVLRQTSILPFVAIIEGRTAFAPAEIGLVRFMLSVSMFSVFMMLHEILFTVRAI
ncbi:MAG: NnrU family protein [Asticcacaulis sp.]